jgi:predicted porin
MKKIFSVLCAALLAGTAATATPVFAEEAKGLKADDVKNALGMSIYLQGGYTYNLNDPASQTNDLRVFDHSANSFTLDLAELVFAKDPAVGVAGYKLKLSAGETAKWIHSRGMSGAPLASAQQGEGTDSFDVTEAYMSYTAAVGKGVRFDFGKMATYHGAEVIEAKDNPNYSRSFLFNYAIPFTHTGLKVSYGFTDALSASFHVVNGWDNATDNNRGKTLGVSIGYAPADAFSGYLNLMTGPEQDNSNNKRSLVDVVATIKPTKKLALILNADYGKEARAITATNANAKWYGVAAIAKYDLNEKQDVAVRAEYFNDKDGARTTVAQALKEVTLTYETKLDGGLIVRPEFRYDMSDQHSFDNGAKKSQETIALGVMYNW